MSTPPRTEKSSRGRRAARSTASARYSSRSNVDRFFEQDADDALAADGHGHDLGDVARELVGGAGHPHAARLAATAGERLRLDDQGQAQRAGDLERIGTVGLEHPRARDRDTPGAEELFALVFEEVHEEVV